MARFTKKAIQVLNNPELRCVAVHIMGLPKLESWRIKPAQLETWAYQNKDQLKEGDPTVLADKFGDKFRPGILDYVQGLHNFLNGELKELPTWDGEAGVATQTHVEAAETLSDEALPTEEVGDAEAAATQTSEEDQPAETQQAAEVVPVQISETPKPVKRRRGRPKGSKNKPVEEDNVTPKKKLTLKKRAAPAAAEPTPTVDLSQLVDHLAHLDKEISANREGTEQIYGTLKELTGQVYPRLTEIEKALVVIARGLYEGDFTDITDVANALDD